MTQDVAEEPEEPPVEIAQTGPPPIEQKIEWWRELTRTGLAGVFTVIFTLTISASFAAIPFGLWAPVKEWLDIILPAETGLLGSAVGFYFGTRRR